MSCICHQEQDVGPRGEVGLPGGRANVQSDGVRSTAIGHAEAAVQIAEAADHPFTLYNGLFDLGRAHLRRGDLRRWRHSSWARATVVL